MPIQGLLIDFDGVIATGAQPLPGAIETLKQLQQNNLPFRILSNGTLYPRSDIAAWFQTQGVDISPEMLLTPAAAATRWLQAQNLKTLYLVTNSRLHPEFAAFTLTDADSGADAVIISDMDDELTMARLNGALRQLLSGARLVSLGLGRYWRAADGMRLDTGAFTKGLEYATGAHAEVMGKPTRFTFEHGATQLGLPPANVAMIGDDVLSDVGAAQDAGLLGILVRTGKFRPEDLQRGIVPDAVINSLPDILGLLQAP